MTWLTWRRNRGQLLVTAGFLAAVAADGAVFALAVRENNAGRYWQFQWTEAGILLVATTLLGGALAYRVARRGAST